MGSGLVHWNLSGGMVWVGVGVEVAMMEKHVWVER